MPIIELFGEKHVFKISQDDKSRLPRGIAAANNQAPILMRFESDYRITLPDHDFVVAPSHKLIPSVYAVCEITSSGKVTYSGPTYVALGSAKHSSSTARSHSKGFADLVELKSSRPSQKNAAGEIKPIVIITVDGGADENPRYPKVLAAAGHLFLKYDVDALFIATNAPGHSAFNEVERRMAPLSKELFGLIFPHDH